MLYFFRCRKKSDASKIPAVKALTKKTVPKSPNTTKKRQTSPENTLTTPTLAVIAPSDEMVHRSTEDLESVSNVWCFECTIKPILRGYLWHKENISLY